MLAGLGLLAAVAGGSPATAAEATTMTTTGTPLTAVTTAAGPTTATTTRFTTSTTGCIPENGRVIEIGATYLRFAIPGRVCFPQAVFFARVLQPAEDGTWITVASGSGMRDFSDPGGGSVLVTGLQPSTTYWYAFYDMVSAPRAGPVTTLPSTTTATTATGTPACTARFLLREQWPGGFRADVTVTAGQAGVAGWSVGWQFSAGQVVVTSWNAVLAARATGGVKATNVSWNGALQPGATATFGLIGTWSGSNPVPPVSCG